MPPAPLLTGDALYTLIPQRPPMVMVDAFYEGDDRHAVAGLTIDADTCFCHDGRLTAPGLIEHMAQSAAAHAGHTAIRRLQRPPVGLIGEIKDLAIERLPAVGEVLKTTVTIQAEVGDITLITAETYADDRLVAKGSMKIAHKND